MLPTKTRAVRKNIKAEDPRKFKYKIAKYIDYSIEKKNRYKKVYKGRESRRIESSYRRVRQINLILKYEPLSTKIESFKRVVG